MCVSAADYHPQATRASSFFLALRLICDWSIYFFHGALIGCIRRTEKAIRQAKNAAWPWARTGAPHAQPPQTSAEKKRGVRCPADSAKPKRHETRATHDIPSSRHPILIWRQVRTKGQANLAPDRLFWIVQDYKQKEKDLTQEREPVS